MRRLIPLILLLSACPPDDTPLRDGGVEGEPNNTVATATPIAAGVATFGAIASAADVDCFTISVAAGEVIVFEVGDGASDTCLGETLDSFLDVYDGAGTLIAEDDDDGPAMCSRITHRAPAAGAYTACLKVSVDGGNLPYDYALTVHVVTPTTTTEVEPNGDAAAATPFTVADGAMFAGVTSPPFPPADMDYLSFTLAASTHLRVETVGRDGSSCGLDGKPIDNTLDLYDSSGARLVQDYDNGLFYCAVLDTTLAAGSYTIANWPSSLSDEADLPVSYGLVFFILD